MPEQPAGERTEDATPRRRQEARKRGTVAKSQDLVGACALLAFALLAPNVAQGVVSALGRTIRSGYGSIPNDLSFASVTRYVGSVAGPLVLAVAPLFFGLMLVGLATNFAQVGFVLSGEPLKPNFEKLNPASGFKRLFSQRAVVEGVKAPAKMLLFGWLVFGAIASEWPKLLGLAWLTPAAASALLGGVMHEILVRTALMWLVLAGLDFFFQKQQVDKQLKMTKQELKQEMKEQEGSPEIKIAIAQRRRKLLKGGIARKIRSADVIVTNPTHFAVAIKYERSGMPAPMVVAKGQDYLALKIREIAAEAKIPLVENKPLARALYKQCEPGDYVPRDLFGPVAEVLAYVYRTVKKVRSAA